MVFEVNSQSNAVPQEIAPTKIIDSRELYRSCHVWLPNWGERVSAIFVDRAYYSFFRAVRDAEEALVLTAKFGRKGNPTVITKIPKGYAIWVIEPDASPVMSGSESTNY